MRRHTAEGDEEDLRAWLRARFPGFTDAELDEAEDALREYVAVVREIAERLSRTGSRTDDVEL